MPALKTTALFALLCVMLLVFGCSAESTAPVEETSLPALENFETAITTPALSYSGIGHGLDLSGNDFAGEGKALCHPGIQGNLRWNLQTSFRSTPISSIEELRRELDVFTSTTDLRAGLIPVDEVIARVRTQHPEDKGFNLILQIGLLYTVDRLVAPTSQEENLRSESNCLPDAPADASVFVEECGTHYVNLEQMGGLVIAFADLTDLPREERLHLEEHPVGFLEELPASTDSGSQSTAETPSVLQWNAAVIGLEHAPGFSDPDHRGWTISVSTNWGEWLNERIEAAGKAFDDQRFDARAFGIPLRFDTRQYTQHNLNDCGISGVSSLDLRCVGDFLEAASEIQGPAAVLTTRLEEADWLLNNKERVLWASPEERSISQYEHFHSEVSSCLETLATRHEHCLDALHSAVEEEADLQDALCTSGACDYPSECEPHRLLAASEELPQAHVFAPGEPFEPVVYHLEQGRTSPFLATDDWLCVTAGLSGRLDSGSEGVSLSTRVDDGNGRTYWYGEVKSSFDRASERLDGYYHCIPRNAFSSPLSREDDLQWHSVTEDSEEGELGGLDKGWAIRGVVGGLNAPGEGVAIGNNERARTYSLHNDRGYLGAQFVGFGLAEPALEHKRFYSGLTGSGLTLTTKGETKHLALAPLELGFCYLSKISGAFESGEEYVRIRAHGDRWYLTARSAAGNRIRVTARCVYYDQKDYD